MFLFCYYQQQNTQSSFENTFNYQHSEYDKIEILDDLNKFNCKVQFTHERATNNTLPFLDCLTEGDNEGRLQTKVYRKKTHTGQYIQNM